MLATSRDSRTVRAHIASIAKILFHVYWMVKVRVRGRKEAIEPSSPWVDAPYIAASPRKPRSVAPWLVAKESRHPCSTGKGRSVHGSRDSPLQCWCHSRCPGIATGNPRVQTKAYIYRNALVVLIIVKRGQMRVWVRVCEEIDIVGRQHSCASWVAIRIPPSPPVLQKTRFAGFFLFCSS